MPSSTAEAIKDGLSKKSWDLNVVLFAVDWYNGKVYMEIHIKIPPALRRKSPKILATVASLANMFPNDLPTAVRLRTERGTTIMRKERRRGRLGKEQMTMKMRKND